MESMLHFSYTTGFWNEFFTTVLECVCVCVCVTYYSQDLWDIFLNNFLTAQLFIEYVTKEVESKRSKPMSSSDSSDSSFFAFTFSSPAGAAVVDGAGPPAGATPAAGACPPAPT